MRGKAVVGVVAVSTVLLAGVLVYRLDVVMKSRPAWQPPAFQIREQTRQSFTFFNPVADTEVGFVCPSNLRQTVTTTDFTFVRITDSFGFPNRNSWPAHADFVLTGDSLLLGEGVGVDRAFASLADDELQDETIVNLGNPGAGLERQRLIYDRYGARLAPSLVVAALFIAADLSNDHHFFAWRNDSLGMEYNEFRLGYERRRDAGREDLERRLERHPVYSWVESFVEPLLWDARRIRHRRRMPDGQELYFERKGVKAAKSVLAVDDPDLVAFSASLDRFRASVTAQGAVFAVMLIPSKEEVFAINQPPPPGSPITRIKALLDAKGIPYLDLYPIVAASGDQATPYFQRDIHLNRYGNQVVADAFVEWYERSMKPSVRASVDP